ncbi:hypothetical protein LEP1GSC170_2782, partial [Leptospira interrogans serovar Bataviae str. HAI135]
LNFIEISSIQSKLYDFTKMKKFSKIEPNPDLIFL